MTKRIQIPEILYENMVSYIEDHYDPMDRTRFEYIQRGVNEKRDAAIRHNLYSGYKTADEPETREMLRQAYLSETGITALWPAEVDLMVKNGDYPFIHPPRK